MLARAIRTPWPWHEPCNARSTVLTPVVALVGAEYEENLSLRYLAAAVEQAGFRAEIVRFGDEVPGALIAHRVLALNPLVVGVSLPFQLRARQLLGVAAHLRELGYGGHVCVGGHFATFEYDNLLRDFPAIDSAVRHEGEDAFRELCVMVREEIGHTVSDRRQVDEEIRHLLAIAR